MYFCMYSKYNKENYQQKKRNKEKKLDKRSSLSIHPNTQFTIINAHVHK